MQLDPATEHSIPHPRIGTHIELHDAPGACSLAVHIALREIGANVHSVAVDMVKDTTVDGTDFHTTSPRSYVPVLQLDDGTRHD